MRYTSRATTLMPTNKTRYFALTHALQLSRNLAHIDAKTRLFSVILLL
jgi:hypothetical protein